MNKKRNKPNLEEAFKYLQLFALMLFGAALLGLWLAATKALLKYWEMGNPL